MKNAIDIVILWVDGDDPEWRKSKAKHSDKMIPEGLDNGTLRYRDWDNLQYLFRGIDKFAPWVRKVHFVTYGHLPSWLNIHHPKLKVVNHEDYIPEKYLPTFSSHPIELNLHRIKDLSECFVYFNDDMFITAPVKPNDFFVNGLPCDMAVNTRITSRNYHDPIAHIILNNTAIINKNFAMKDVVRTNLPKWLNHRYGITNLLRSISYFPYPTFTGFINTHLPAPLLKSTFKQVWSAEPELLDTVSANKFRSREDVSQYLIRDWQLVTGRFWPKNFYKEGTYYDPNEANIDEIARSIISQRHKLVCINDSSERDINELKTKINSSFNEILPDKSSYEI